MENHIPWKKQWKNIFQLSNAFFDWDDSITLASL